MIILSWLGMCWNQRLHLSALEWIVKCMNCIAIRYKCMFSLCLPICKVSKLINILNLTTQHQQSMNTLRAFRIYTKQIRYMWLMGQMADHLTHSRLFHLRLDNSYKNKSNMFVIFIQKKCFSMWGQHPFCHENRALGKANIRETSVGGWCKPSVWEKTITFKNRF